MVTIAWKKCDLQHDRQTDRQTGEDVTSSAEGKTVTETTEQTEKNGADGDEKGCGVADSISYFHRHFQLKVSIEKFVTSIYQRGFILKLCHQPDKRG